MCSTSEIFYKSSSPHWAVVLHTYRPKCDDELCLTTGQAIQVLSIDPKVSGSDGWWVGQDNYGQVGVFPANYVQLQVSGSDDDDDHQHHRNSSEGQGSSLQDSTSSFSLDGTLVANRVATQLLLADSARGTGGESDGEGRLRRNFKWDSSVVGLSHLRVIKFEDVTLGDVATHADSCEIHRFDLFGFYFTPLLPFCCFVLNHS
uniref:Mitogen-activated protein kinase kinase kinase n=1 Tax=Mesocestoides corti TaxID=53468 RepID=A0A5K3FL14_MESCO